MFGKTSFFIILLFSGTISFGQLSTHWEELVATDWDKALQQSDSTCILPFGILEKHGPHSPIGTDLIKVRELVARATKREYTVVFPEYYFGQIYEAKQQPGTFALPSRVVWDMLDATCEEIARNGFKKIIIVNGHGGNPNLIHYYSQSQLEKKRNYVLYFFEPPSDSAYNKKLAAMRKTDASYDQHAGESETSMMMYLRPDLLKMDRASSQSGVPLKRISIPNAYTAIWWYADYPNHYAGDGSKATAELGKFICEHFIDELVKTTKAIKADTKTRAVQDEYFDRVLGEKK